MRVTVILGEPLEGTAFRTLCRAEDRAPRDQAYRLVREGLERVGALPMRPSWSPERASALVAIQPLLPCFDDDEEEADTTDLVELQTVQSDPDPDPEPWEAC